MIEIDGSYHEGGGQIVRTACGLSAFTGEAVRIVNIRANRPNPGLQAQHLAAIHAVAILCNAQVKGDSIGSTTIEFIPSREIRSEVHVTIHTAGSCGLVLQTMFAACLGIKQMVRIDIDGGATFGKWAPPISYIKQVFLPAAARFGFFARIEVLRHGFYPTGGAHIVCEIEPIRTSEAKCTEFTEYSIRPRITGISIASRELEGRQVAFRQARSAEKIINESERFEFGGIEATYDNTPCTGSGIVLWTECPEGDGIFIGGSAIGERGKSAEEAGREAAAEIIEAHMNKGCVDKYLADQLVPFLGFFGGSIRTSEITAHTRTNIWVVEKFSKHTKHKFDINETEKQITAHD